MTVTIGFMMHLGGSYPLATVVPPQHAHPPQVLQSNHPIIEAEKVVRAGSMAGSNMMHNQFMQQSDAYTLDSQKALTYSKQAEKRFAAQDTQGRLLDIFV